MSCGEPDAQEWASPVRRAGRGNGPAVTPAPRPGPTQPLVDVAHAGLLLGEPQPDRGEDRLNLDLQRLSVGVGARYHHHEVVRVPNMAIHRKSLAAASLTVVIFGHRRLPDPGEVLVEGREGDVREARRENPALRGAGLAAPDRAVLGEDPSDQERLDQVQYAFVRDSTAHPVQKGR